MRIVPLLLFVIVLAGCAATDPNGKKLTAIVGATLIDGTSQPSIERSIVIVEGALIRAAGPQSAVPIPKEAEIVDAAGKVIASGDHPIAAGQEASFSVFSAAPGGHPGAFERAMLKGQWTQTRP